MSEGLTNLPAVRVRKVLMGFPMVDGNVGFLCETPEGQRLISMSKEAFFQFQAQGFKKEEE